MVRKMKLYLSLSTLIWLCATASAQTTKQARKIAQPFLIVPGWSIGKVQLGQKQEVVRQKMGQPAKSEMRPYGTVVNNFQTFKVERKILGTLLVDIWLRALSPQDKKLSRSNVFKVMYQNGIVVQITTTLSGYKTAEGLSINSTQQEFSQQFGEVDERNQTSVDGDSERPAGDSAFMKDWWDYKKQGLSVESRWHIDMTDQKNVTIEAISVHPSNRLHWFLTTLQEEPTDATSG